MLNWVFLYLAWTAGRIRVAEVIRLGETEENDGTEAERETAEEGGEVWWNLTDPR